MDIWRSLRLVKNKPWLFLLGTVLGFLLVIIGPSLASKPLAVYKSTAKILITPNTTSLSDASQRTVDSAVRSWFIDENTIRALLSSQDLLDVVLESAGSKASWLELRDRVQLNILSNTGQSVSLMEVSVLGSKAEEVRILTQLLSEKFIQYVQQLSAAEHDKTVAFLERERRNAEREVARTHKRLLKIGIVPASAGGSSLDQAWVQLQQRRNELEQEAAMSQAEVDQLEVAQQEGVEVARQAGDVGNVLQNSVAKEQLKLEELLEVYTERSPQVQEQRRRLKRAQELELREFKRQVDGRRHAAEVKNSRVKSLLNETQRRLKKLDEGRPSPEKYLQYATEERQLAMWQDSYLDLTRQLYKARVMQQSARREGAFTVVEKPVVGKLVSSPLVNRSLASNIAIAIPMSFLMGLGLVILSDYLSSSLRLEPRIEEALGLPVLGRIPFIAEDASSGWDHMKQNLQRPKSAG